MVIIRFRVQFVINLHEWVFQKAEIAAAMSLNRVVSLNGLGIVDEGVMFGFLNRDAISDQNTPFSIRLYALVVLLTIMIKIISVFRPKGLKKPSFWGGTYLYS